MSNNMVQPGRPHIEIWQRVPCWISKATRAQARALAPALTHARAHIHTHKYVIIIAFPQQQWFRERA